MDEIERQIEKTVEGLATREQFADLLELLARDYDENLFAWNNQDLRSFLRALAVYARGEGGYFREFVTQDTEPTWALFADMLCAARAYIVDD